MYNFQPICSQCTLSLSLKIWENRKVNLECVNLEIILGILLIFGKWLLIGAHAISTTFNLLR